MVISQLEPKLDSLIELMAALKIPSSNQADALGPGGRGSEERNSEIAEGVSQLKRVAEKVVSSASTVIGSGSTTWGGSVFSYQPELGDHQLEGISRWNLETIREAGKGKGPHEDEGLGAESDSDSDDEIDREVMNQMISEGRACNMAGNCEGAIKFYRSALRVADSIRLPSQSAWSPALYNGMLLDLAFVTMTKKDAEMEAMQPVTQLLARYDNVLTSGLPPGITNQITTAIFLLSGIQWRLGQLSEAESGCRRVMQAISRSEGKDTIRYLNSIRLMVAICEAKNDMELATAYRRMLPARKGMFKKHDVFTIHDIYVPSWVSTPLLVDRQGDNELLSSSSVITLVKTDPTSALLAAPVEEDWRKKYQSSSLAEGMRKISSPIPSTEMGTEPRNPSSRGLTQKVPTDIELATDSIMTQQRQKPMRSQKEVREHRYNPFYFPILKDYFGDKLRKHAFLVHLRSDRLEYNFKSLDFDPHQAVIKAIHTSDTWALYVFLFHFDEMKKWWKKGMGRSVMLKTQYTNFPKEIDLNYRDDEGQTILEIAWAEVQRQPEHYIVIVLLFAYGADVDYIIPGVFQEVLSGRNQIQEHCRVLVDKLTKMRNEAREKEGKVLPYNTKWRD